ncbi:MAG: hypothetical protein ACO3YV_04515 [Pelagibacteraceae bacterium]
MVEINVPDGFNTRDRDACYNLVHNNLKNLTFTKGEVTVVKLVADEPGFLLAALAEAAPYGVDLAVVGKHLQNKATILCGPNQGKVINV